MEKKCANEKIVPVHKLSDGQVKKARWIKMNQGFAEEFDTAGYPELAEKLRDCHTTNQLALCQSCGHKWYVVNLCRQRVCALCSWRIANERQQYIMALTRNMDRPKMITLTTPPVLSNPQQGIKDLREAWNKLKKNKIMKLCRGGAYSIEVKINETYYHIHMHVILDMPYLPQKKLFAVWRKIIGHRCPQVDIRAASTEVAKRYICKDAAKNMVMYTNRATIVKWYEATKGARLFATFGSWYNAKLEDLVDQEIPGLFAPECPNCKAQHSMFLARDGPFVCGHNAWEEVWLPLIRDIPFMTTNETFGYLAGKKKVVDDSDLDCSFESDIPLFQIAAV